MGGRPEVRPLLCVGGLARSAEPVDRKAARAHLADDALGAVALAQTGAADALEGLDGHVGHVDVEQNGPFVLAAFKITLDDELRNLRGGVEFGPALVDLREGDGGNAEEVALDGRRDRARVHRVVAHVGAAVDA